MSETGRTVDFLSFTVDLSSPAAVAAYDELPLWSAMFGLLLLDEVPLAGIGAALDVGCGTGFPLIELAERLGSRTEVHGIEPWSGALERAAQKIALRGTPNVILHEGNAAAMPFGDSSFDLIVSNLGLNDFEDPEAAIRECRRVAKGGAVLALTTNLQGHMREFYEVVEHLLREDDDAQRLRRLRDHIEHRATVAGIGDLFQRHRFRVRRVVERNGAMRFASGEALLNHFFIKLGFLPDWKKVLAGREETLFASLLDRLDAIAEREGALRLTIPMAYAEAEAV